MAISPWSAPDQPGAQSLVAATRGQVHKGHQKSSIAGLLGPAIFGFLFSAEILRLRP
jgi:hypothetical protein